MCIRPHSRKRSSKVKSAFIYIEESRDAIYFTRADGTFINANPSFLELFGYTRSELLSINARELYADPSERLRFRREVEARQAVREFEVRLRAHDGRILDCLLTSTVHLNSSGEVLWYQGMIHDVTARREAEAALARSEHFARTIVSSVGEGVIVYDRGLRYQVWNRFMEEMTGLSATGTNRRICIRHFSAPAGEWHRRIARARAGGRNRAHQ